MPAAKTALQKKEEAMARYNEKQNQTPVKASTEPMRTERRKRGVAGGVGQKLRVDYQIEGYHLYWMNDVPGRIPEAIEGGYEHVKEKEVFSYTDSEEYVKRLVGTSEGNDGMYAYLMKIRQDWYEEDQAAIQSQNDKFEAAIRQGKLDAPDHSYGSENIKFSN